MLALIGTLTGGGYPFGPNDHGAATYAYHIRRRGTGRRCGQG